MVHKINTHGVLLILKNSFSNKKSRIYRKVHYFAGKDHKFAKIFTEKSTILLKRYTALCNNHPVGVSDYDPERIHKLLLFI